MIPTEGVTLRFDGPSTSRFSVEPERATDYGRRPMRTTSVLWGLVALGACNPYSNRDGEFSAGAVDPVNFPPAYVGVGGDRTRPGRGSFTEVRAYANGNPIGYYAFPFSTTQLPTTPGANVDPMRLIDNGMPYAKVPAPLAYAPSMPCVPPGGYVYDPRTDEVRYDQQGAIFSVLPTATYALGALPSWSYVPVVSEVPVGLSGEACQQIKSEAALKAIANSGTADGKYLAWAIIDVAAPVYRVGQTSTTSNGFGTQKLGWYNHYIVAYLDGGYVPTMTPADGSKTVMVAQKLYYPRSLVNRGGNTLPGGFGFGYDVLQAARTDANYSPVCQMFTYDAGMAVDSTALPKDEATILAMYGSTVKPATVPYQFCLQVP
jgi:hypothetical protein